MRQLTAVGGDVFAGLFTYGVKKAGFKVLAQLEHTNYGNGMLKANFPNLEVQIGYENWELNRFRGVDFMFTNPPCSAWSSARTRGGSWREQSDKLTFIRELVGAGLVIQPRAWCWESVTNAWKNGKDFIHEEVIEPWAKAGYSFTVLLQNNKYIGGLQNRKRFFAIAHTNPLVWPKFVEPKTVGQILNGVVVDDDEKPWLGDPTLWEQCPDHGYKPRHVYQRMSDRERKRMKNWQPLGTRSRLNRATIPSFMIIRERLDRPPHVWIGEEKRWHPTEPRLFSFKEACLLCGLPKSWKPDPDAGLARNFTMLSRAVMPGVGKWLATAVKDGLKKRRLRKPQYQVVDFLDPENPNIYELEI